MGISEILRRFLKEQLKLFWRTILIGGIPVWREFCNSTRSRINRAGQGTEWQPIIWYIVNEIISNVMGGNHP